MIIIIRNFKIYKITGRIIEIRLQKLKTTIAVK